MIDDWLLIRPSPRCMHATRSACNAQLSKSRKKRAVAESLATPEELASASVLSSHPLHATTQGGISAIVANPDRPSVVATAGLDGTVQVWHCNVISSYVMFLRILRFVVRFESARSYDPSAYVPMRPLCMLAHFLLSPVAPRPLRSLTAPPHECSAH